MKAICNDCGYRDELVKFVDNKCPECGCVGLLLLDFVDGANITIDEDIVFDIFPTDESLDVFELDEDFNIDDLKIKIPVDDYMYTVDTVTEKNGKSYILEDIIEQEGKESITRILKWKEIKES
jgi:hypothetical protein